MEQGTPTPGSLPRWPTGFPSSALEDYADARLDLNALLIRHPAATFYMLVNGSAMEHDGIRTGDIVVVDRSLEARPGHVIIATLDGQLVIRRLVAQGEQRALVTSRATDALVIVSEDLSLTLWGVVTWVIHPLLAPFPHVLWDAPPPHE